MEIETAASLAPGTLDKGSSDQAMEGNKDAVSVSPTKSYAATVVVAAGNNSTGVIFGEGDVILQDGDVQIDRSGPYPKTRFSKRVHESIEYNMRRSIIVRLLGKTIGYRMLWNKIKLLWQPQEQFQIIDLDNGYYLVRLELESDYTRILTEGPWMVFASYLTVQPWLRNFDTSDNYPLHVMVWIRLPGLPYRYYKKSLFSLLTSEIGQVIKVDYNKTTGKLGNFARLAVAVD
ncbi:hypothetical protein F3Y22_tig00110429pilonHSYRG01193 [Hibiscus syriacus]|uniref:DUF4283 domain-containing protein n=1 Tax=Hibiscus syriacus TaxID=106335 RepID=A0A6A3ALG4_HIBSY|nr:hypothetical protein F3Y22_tig00110429pilonHSYRG01193 [Hibiscus syriacus]